MANRWEHRTEPKPGHEYLYWHILLGDQPQVQAVASIAQERLTGFSGLHFTPQRWLHITTLALGPAEEFTSNHIADMTNHARRLLSRISPITITLSEILYHPEAIALKLEPDGALDSIRTAVRHAIRSAKDRDEPTEHRQWIPHVTLAYSTTVQQAGPIIAALGRNLPACEAGINSVSLIAQEGAERLWNWHRLARVPLEPARLLNCDRHAE
jgi:2'-5' RNA ligase